MYDARHRSTIRRGALPLWVALILSLGAVGGAAAYDALVASTGPAGEAATGPVPGPSASSGTPAEPTPETHHRSQPKGRLLIHGTGDVNLDPSYISSFAANGYAYAWTGLDGLFERDDLTVVNLECPVSDRGTIVPKEFNFRGDPDALPAMRRAGVEVANQGNNHAYDYGPEALVDSLRNLRANRISPVGAGRDEREALSPARFRIDGWRIAVLGFDQVVDPYPEAVAAPHHPGTAAGHDTGAMVKAIRRASRHTDLVVVAIHWGVELDLQPRPEQVALGHRFIDAGADMIFGHHAHRLQPMSTYHGRPIFWGLGNFVWPNFSVEGSTTAVAEVVVERTGRIHGRLLPAYIEASGHPVLQ